MCVHFAFLNGLINLDELCMVVHVYYEESTSDYNEIFVIIHV